MEKHTLVALMEDKPGVLNRVSSLFRRRNYNIESLTVGHSETPGISRMTIVVDGDERIVEQVVKQLDKLINVTEVVGRQRRASGDPRTGADQGRGRAGHPLGDHGAGQRLSGPGRGRGRRRR